MKLNEMKKFESMTPKKLNDFIDSDKYESLSDKDKDIVSECFADKSISKYIENNELRSIEDVYPEFLENEMRIDEEFDKE